MPHTTLSWPTLPRIKWYVCTDVWPCLTFWLKSFNIFNTCFLFIHSCSNWSCMWPLALSPQMPVLAGSWLEKQHVTMPFPPFSWILWGQLLEMSFLAVHWVHMLRHTKRCQIWRTCSCLVLWAGAEYKAILSLALGLNVCPPELLEAITWPVAMVHCRRSNGGCLAGCPVHAGGGPYNAGIGNGGVATNARRSFAKQTASCMVHCTFTSSQ